MIPFLDLGAAYRELKPTLDAAVARVMGSGTYILGEEVDRFEQSFARYVEADHCVGCGNGLDALALALQAMDIGPGDEVVVPSYTFIATWLAVSRLGAIPVPAEPAVGSFNIDAASVERVLSPRTRAVIAVHLYGHPAPIEDLLTLTRARGLRLVEDAAQAHGARWNGRRIGSFGDATTWSFYPAKNLGAMGDGGAVTTDDPAVARRLRTLRNYGSQVKYYNDEKGVNSRLDPLQAAILDAKLPSLDDWNARRCRIAARYDRELRGLPLMLPQSSPFAEPVWHLYVVRSPRRDALMAALHEAGVQSQIHYPVAPHRQKAYAELTGSVQLPMAERLAAEVLSLPIGPHLTDAQVDHVIHAVRTVATTPGIKSGQPA